MEKKTSQQELEATIECYLLAKWYRFYCWEFGMECKRVGFKFVRDFVDHDDLARFAKSFDELVALGCRPRVLASTLYLFHKARISDFLENWLGEQPDKRFVRLPASKTVRKVRHRVEASIEAIEWLNDSGLGALLAKYVKPPQHRKKVLDTLRWYSSVLEMWSKPRRDVTKSFAPIPCCLYSQIATGQFRFDLVSDLIEGLGYKPDPKHQHARRRPKSKLGGNETSDQSGYEPAFQSLERNFNNFRVAHGKTFESLRLQLAHDHVSRQSERPKRINWSAVFAPPDEYYAGNYRRFGSSCIDPNK